MSGPRNTEALKRVIVRTRERSARVLRRAAARVGVPNDRTLVVAYMFPPAPTTSGYVMAKRVAQWARPVDVVTHAVPRKKQDRGALRIADRWVRRTMTVQGKSTELRDWENIERFAREGLAQIENSARERGWYRDVYSRSMMPASHILAADYKLAHPRAVWTAEFSDPLLFDTKAERRTGELPDSPLVRRMRAAISRAGLPVPGDQEMFELVELVVYALADRIVFTNENQRTFMLQYAPPQVRDSIMARSEISPHPEPAAELYECAKVELDLDPAKTHIGYFGAFYASRSARDLLSVFEGLAREERGGLRLHLFTRNTAAAQALVTEAALEDIVEIHRPVPYLEFLAITKQMDWLLVADARVAESHGLNPYLPSKVSDYRGSGTPVIGLIDGSSPMAQVPLALGVPLGHTPDNLLSALSASQRVVLGRTPEVRLSHPEGRLPTTEETDVT